MDGEAWRATVHGIAKSRTRLSDFTSLYSTLTTLDSNVGGESLDELSWWCGSYYFPLGDILKKTWGKDGEDKVEGWEKEMLKGEQICLMHVVFHLLGQSELCFKSYWAIFSGCWTGSCFPPPGW